MSMPKFKQLIFHWIIRSQLSANIWVQMNQSPSSLSSSCLFYILYNVDICVCGCWLPLVTFCPFLSFLISFSIIPIPHSITNLILPIYAFHISSSLTHQLAHFGYYIVNPSTLQKLASSLPLSI